MVLGGPINQRDHLVTLKIATRNEPTRKQQSAVMILRLTSSKKPISFLTLPMYLLFPMFPTCRYCFVLAAALARHRFCNCRGAIPTFGRSPRIDPLLPRSVRGGHKTIARHSVEKTTGGILGSSDFGSPRCARREGDWYKSGSGTRRKGQ